MKRGLQSAALALAAVAAPCCAVALLATPAGAQLLWYDGFEIGDGSGHTYVAGGLHGQEGGTGTFFTGPWIQPDFNPLIGHMQSTAPDPDNPDNTLQHADNWLSAGSLTKAGQNHPSTGDKVGDGPAIFGCCHTARTGRALSAPFAGVDDTIYMSFLVNFGTGFGGDPPNPNDMQFRTVEWWDGGIGDDFLAMQIGYSSFGNFDNPVNGDPGANRRLSLKLRGVMEEFGVTEDRNFVLGDLLYSEQMGKTHNIVIKFDLSTDNVEDGGEGDTVSIWVNALHSDVEPAPDFVFAGIDLNITHMSAMSLFHFIGAQENAGFLDELRVGTSWAEVAITVPEPAAISLFGIAVAGLLIGARRRRM